MEQELLKVFDEQHQQIGVDTREEIIVLVYGMKHFNAGSLVAMRKTICLLTITQQLEEGLSGIVGYYCRGSFIGK